MVIVLLQRRCNCCSALLSRQEAHKAKAPRAVSGWVNHHHSIRDDSKLLEVLSQFVGSGVLGQAPDEQFVSTWHSTLNLNLPSAKRMCLFQDRSSGRTVGKCHIAKAP
jgi:hypothetical protein